MIKQLFILTVFFCVQPVGALTYKLDPNSDIVGAVEYVTVQKGQDMHSIAREYDMGYMDMVEANPTVKPNKLKVGTQLLVPSEFILPPGPRTGIVINLAELRVYYFPPDQNVVITHPLGIGQIGWRTPIGETTIVRKRENPTWTPPPSIRAESARKGITLPDVVPAGPRNPLGDHAMSLGWNGYLMHGTRAPNSIGQRSSHGCMRMYPEDIKNLFEHVEVGTPVRVIYEPYKVGLRNGELFLEAHEFFPDNYYKILHSDKFDHLQETVVEINYTDSDSIDWDAAKYSVNQTHGYPVHISGKGESDAI